MSIKQVDTTTDRDLWKLNIQVGSILYHTEVLNTPWYHGGPVTGFYEPGNPLMVYSFDAKSCGAIMYRNGVDEKDGTASPLPDYAAQLGDFQEVMDWVKAQGGSLVIRTTTKYSIVSIHNKEGKRVTYQAPEPKITVDDSAIALAGCHAFIELYGPGGEE